MQCRKASKFLIKWWLRNWIHMPLSCHEPCSALKRVLREQLVLQILILSGLNFSRVLRVWSFYSLHKMSGKIWLIDAFFQDFFLHYKLFFCSGSKRFRHFYFISIKSVFFGLTLFMSFIYVHDNALLIMYTAVRLQCFTFLYLIL